MMRPLHCAPSGLPARRPDYLGLCPRLMNGAPLGLHEERAVGWGTHRPLCSRVGAERPPLQSRIPCHGPQKALKDTMYISIFA